MSMEITNNYSNYGTVYADSGKKAASDNSSLLGKLQEKYSNFDIMAGNFSQGQISNSKSGFQGVMISPAYLAKAENDEATSKKLDEMLSGVETAQKWLENALAKDGLKLKSSGFFINEKGEIGSYSVVEKKDSMFDALEKSDNKKDSEKLKEKKEKEKAEKKKAEKQLEEEKQLEKSKNSFTVVASSPQEIIEKIREQESDVKETQVTEQEKIIGKNVDYSV